eukprot:jgi/Ulvmu1/7861/UM004_0092.1
MDNSGVNEVWQRLKASTCQPSMDGIVGRVLRNSSRKTCKSSHPVGGLSAAHLGVADVPEEEGKHAITAWRAEEATGLNSGDLESACRPYVQQLTGELISVRQAGMASIQKLIDDPHVPSNDMADAVSSWLGKALVKSMADSAQCIRMSAISMFRDLIKQHPDAILPMLPYAIPVLEGRLHADENGNRQEQSEEIRLLLLQALDTMVQHGGSALAAYMAEVLTILRACMSDLFHEVVIPTCDCLAALARQLRRRLQPAAKQLVADVLPLTTHRRKAVRCAAVRAARQLMFCGAHEMILDMVAWRDPNSVAIKAFYEPDPKVNFCGKLATDEAVAVRLEFMGAIGDWLLHLDERIDHQGRLLPYLITGLTDTSPQVQERSLQLLEEIGVLYEKDNEKDLKDILVYLPEEAHNIGWRSVGDAWAGGHAAGVFPGVFKQRPRVGVRRVVTGTFAGIVGAIACELRGWQPGCRCRAAALLEVYCVFAEDWMQQRLYEVVPAMLQAAAAAAGQRGTGPDAAAASAGLGRCFTMMGLFVPLEAFMRMVEPVLLDVQLPAGLRAAAAAAMREFLNGARHRGGGDECARGVLRVLLESGLPESQSDILKQDLVALVGSCVAHIGDKMLQEAQVDLVDAMLRLQAWPAADTEAAKTVVAAVEADMQQLACRLAGEEAPNGVRSVDELLVRHRQALLQRWCGGSYQADVTNVTMRRIDAAEQAVEGTYTELAACED